MERRNIEGFEIAHPGMSFPWFRPLTTEEMGNIRSALRARLGVEEAADGLQLVKALADASQIRQEFDADSEDFGLRRCLSQLSISPRETVFLNFYRYDDMDELRLEDVDEHFEYMWYPGSDDIDICDGSLAWILSVSHDGEVSVIRF